MGQRRGGGRVRRVRGVTGAWRWAAACAAMAPGAAGAAGIESPELGAVAVGRGGAVAARPTDGLALQFNPAGLGHSHGLQLQVDGKLAWHRLAFTPTHPDLRGDGQAANGQGLYATPTDAALIASFGRLGPLLNVTVGVGAFGPSATGKLKFSPTGAQRYDKIEVDYFLAYYTLGAGVRFLPSWSAGASLQIAQGTATFAQATRPLPGPLSADTDVVATLRASSGALVTGVVGVSFTPNPYWSFGASYRPRVNFTADGTLDAAIPADLAAKTQAAQHGDSASLRLNFPHVARLGALWTPPGERLAVEVNAVYEAWASLREIEVDTHGITVTSVLPTGTVEPIHLVKDYHDAFSLRIGGDYQVLPARLTLRAGYFFEASAIPSRTTGVDFPNFLTHAPSLGLSLQAFGASIDVGYSYHFMPTRQVDDGAITAVSVPPSPGPQPGFAAVNNGRYTSGQHVLGLGVRVPIDRLQRTF